MDLEAIVNEMQRRPDAQVVLEWIYGEATDVPWIREAIDAYFEGLES